MLTDFGIARVGDGNVATGIGEIVGTAQFVSPEQASGTAVDGRSDLYSLGVTAFYALTGRLPFEAPTVMGLLGMHLTQAPPPVATVRESLPPKLSTAVDRCLAKDPANRFATGEQLAEAIADARGGDMQIAPVVRGFLRDRARTGHEVALLYSAVLYLGAIAHLPFLRAAGPLSLLAVASVVRLFQTARRLMRAGYGFDDVRIALWQEADARREEFGITTDDDARLQLGARFRVAGAGAFITGLLIIPVGIKRGNIALSALGAASAFAGFVLLIRTKTDVARQQRLGLVGRWLDGLWQGRLGKWFFALADTSDESLFARLRRRLSGGSDTGARAPAEDSSTRCHPRRLLRRPVSRRHWPDVSRRPRRAVAWRLSARDKRTGTGEARDGSPACIGGSGLGEHSPATPANSRRPRLARGFDGGS